MSLGVKHDGVGELDERGTILDKLLDSGDLTEIFHYFRAAVGITEQGFEPF